MNLEPFWCFGAGPRPSRARLDAGRRRLMEFIEGAARLKGSAKALDIWRLETKVEAPAKRTGRRAVC